MLRLPLRLWIRPLVGFVSLAVSLTAFAAPNLSGEWKLNVSKSQYGAFPAPSSMTRTIKLEGSSLSMSTVQKGAQGDLTTQYVYTTDGKVSVNQTARGPVSGTARWDGNSLVIESSQEVNHAELKSREVWTLSADGRTLTILTHITLPQQGEYDVKQVFEKQ